MKIKKGVKVQGLTCEILLAIFAANRIFMDEGPECIVTSCMEGKHSAKSRHKIGYAVDFRTRHCLAAQAKRIAQRLQLALGTEYYVLLESDHIHIGYHGTDL